MRVDPLLVLAAGAASGPLLVLAPVPTAVVAVALVVWLRRRALALATVLLLVLAAVRARASFEEQDARRLAFVDARPEQYDITGILVTSPTLVGDRLRVDVESAIGRVGLNVPPNVELARGDRVVAIAQLAPPYRFWTEASDPRPREARRKIVLSGGAEHIEVTAFGAGPHATIDRLRTRIRARILATFPPRTAPMARALVLGEDDLTSADQQAFRRSGLAHLLAVSGMHLVLVVMAFVAAIRGLLARITVLAARGDVGRLAAAFGIPLAWLYADLAGGSGSAIRAAWMVVFALLARVLARRPDASRSLALSALAMTVLDPLVALDLSFLLSAFATAGLVFLARPIESRLHRLPSIVAAPIAATTAATIACAPILALMAPTLPLAGLIANVVAVPLGEAAALPLCLVHTLLVGWPAAERGCALAASGALELVRLVATSFTWGGVPVPAPTAGQLGALAVAVVMSGRSRRLAVSFAIVATLGLEAAVRYRGQELVVTFVDVGQGDAALVELPSGRTMLIDGGGIVGSPVDVGERVLAPLLRARRIGAIDVVVLSHPHPDHYLGLRGALAGIAVRELWDTGQGEAEAVAGPYAELLQGLRSRGVRVVHPDELCGKRTTDGVTIDVLAPCPAPAPDRGPNDNSFVLRISYGARSILFSGDAEQSLESEMVRQAPRRLRADVLKVGHHGSRTSSTPAFVAAVAPSIAVISCGVRNRFGHPHPNALAALAGTRVLRTDRQGSIRIVSDGASLDVQLLSTTPMYGRFR